MLCHLLASHLALALLQRSCCMAVQGNVFVNQYLIIKDLGRGAHGTVKLVLDTEDQTVYAMKASAPIAMYLSNLPLQQWEQR
jgi:[calcium/calmodulin-dependent protein kinase] kinase